MKTYSARPAIVVLFLAALLCGTACEESTSNPEPEAPIDTCRSELDPNLFPPATISFADDILPLMRSQGCTSTYCHGGAYDYRVLSADEMMQSGPQARELGLCAIVRGAPESSYLIWKLEGRSEIRGARMPFNRDHLEEADIEMFRQWIREGARDN